MVITSLFLITPISFAKTINWYDYKTGVEISKKTNKKLYLFFHADWCHWCGVMKKKTLDDIEVAAYLNKNFIPVSVNVDNNRDLVKNFRIGPIPASIFMEPGGTQQIYLNKKNAKKLLGAAVPVGTIPGYHKKGKFYALLKMIKHEEYKNR